VKLKAVSPALKGHKQYGWASIKKSLSLQERDLG